MTSIHQYTITPPTKYDTVYAYKNIRNKEQNDTHIFVTYILNTLRRFTVCYCGEKWYEKYRRVSGWNLR